MLAHLGTCFSDARSADLCLELGLERLDAHAELPLRFGEARLDLRVVGASHQAILETPAGVCSEVVACLPDRRTGLPSQQRCAFDGLHYEFNAQVLALSPSELSTHSRALRAEVGRGRCGLVGASTGNPEALTALRASRRDDEVRWQTWHAYPHTGELVVTRTSVRPAA